MNTRSYVFIYGTKIIYIMISPFKSWLYRLRDNVHLLEDLIIIILATYGFNDSSQDTAFNNIITICMSICFNEFMQAFDTCFKQTYFLSKREQIICCIGIILVQV